jgi:hypothetical protein
MSDATAVCRGCWKPITEGEHRWAMREPEELWHWDCAQQSGLIDRLNPLMRGAHPTDSSPTDLCSGPFANSAARGPRKIGTGE